jgi:nitrate/nitrite transport system permease protein
VGFGVAALVGIPLGFIIGRFAFMNSMLAPIISLLRRSRRWPGCPSA